MSIQNPIGEPPRDPYKEYQKIQEALEGGGGKEQGPPNQSGGLFAYVLHWMHNMVDFLLKKPKELSLDKTLTEFKRCLEILQKEDPSTEDDFLAHFSDTWILLLQNSAARKDLIDLRALIREIQSYPEGADYSLGYYLTEHAGKEWAPMPYRELIQKIHFTGRDILTKWLSQIDQLLVTSL